MPKRKIIIKNAIELFAIKGFESTSIQEITDKCGISKGAFYLSFKSKDELVISIIEHFMTELFADIDQLVNSDYPGDHKLFSLYSIIFEFLQEHRKFALIFAMEQMHQMNQNLYAKMAAYDAQFSISLLKLIDNIYGSSIETIKYDLLLCIKGNMKSHSEFLILNKLPINIALLSHSLVDITNAIAYNATTGFVTKEMFNHHCASTEHTMTSQQAVEKIKQLLSTNEDELETESLVILLEQLQAESPSQAIMQGMMNTLRKYPRCRLLIVSLEQLLAQ